MMIYQFFKIFSPEKPVFQGLDFTILLRAEIGGKFAISLIKKSSAIFKLLTPRQMIDSFVGLRPIS